MYELLHFCFSVSISLALSMLSKLRVLSIYRGGSIMVLVCTKSHQRHPIIIQPTMYTAGLVYVCVCF